MRYRYLLVLILLAVVFATGVAMGPVLWDALTLLTVEEHWPNGQMKSRYYRRLWESVDRDWSSAIDLRDHDAWYGADQVRELG